MSEALILAFNHPLLVQWDYKTQLEKIFFETTTRTHFNDFSERELFYWKYLGYYLAHYPEYGRAILIDGEILGYLAGMPWSHDPNLYALQPHMKLFSQNYVNYPAHLHINFTHKARGQGLGRLLVESFMQQLVTLGLPGVHIMTGLDSENRFFYRKLGFHFELEKEGILFMGMSFNRV